MIEIRNAQPGWRNDESLLVCTERKLASRDVVIYERQLYRLKIRVSNESLLSNYG